MLDYVIRLRETQSPSEQGAMRYRITTPEQVYFHYEVAGLGSRALAWLLDQAFLMALRIAIFIAFAPGGAWGLASILILIFVLDFGYFVGVEYFWAGQSLGKRPFGLRVISGYGGRLRFHDILIRNLMRPIDTLPMFMMTGGMVAFCNRYHRRLGDMVADTLVIRDVSNEIPAAMLAQQSRVNTFREDAALRGRVLARVTREERDLMLDLMWRRDELEAGVREELFGLAAGYYRKRFDLPDDLEYLSDEQTVINLALLVQETKFTA